MYDFDGNIVKNHKEIEEEIPERNAAMFSA